jgi:tetratricopeptide (TPR) repeat protein
MCAKQLSRSRYRFEQGSAERGVIALSGALAIVRPGQLGVRSLGADGPSALSLAAREFAKRGEEGRARAVYELLARGGPPAEQADARDHIAAIDVWLGGLGKGQALQSAGIQARAAVYRALLEPSAEAMDAAAQRLGEWISRALQLRDAYVARRITPSRDEGQEAFRALGEGPTLLVALHLRHADAKGALAAVDRASAKPLLRGDLLRALQRVQDKPTPDRWIDVLRTLRGKQGERGQEDEESAIEADAVRAANFGVLIEAYRLDASQPEVAGALATLLVDFGMAEAAPAVLVPAAAANPEPRMLSGAMAVTLRAMAEEVEAEDAEAARRAFVAAKPLLDLATKTPGNLQPSPARVYGLMGEIFLREGDAKAARPHLERSLGLEKNPVTMLQLARVDAFDHRVAPALARLKEAAGHPEVLKAPAAHAEFLLAQSDIEREDGAVPAARASAEQALRVLAAALPETEGDGRARIERLIARTLDRLGAVERATKALERALAAAPSDKRQAGATLGQQVSRALLLRDAKLGKESFARSLSYDLEPSELVYSALWLRALEKLTKAPSDGAAERVLSQLKDDKRWSGRLASFALGGTTEPQLMGFAKSNAQRAEAAFYIALARRAKGDDKGADEALRQVVATGAIELVETQLAKDMLAGAGARLPGRVPDVGIP